MDYLIIFNKNILKMVYPSCALLPLPFLYDSLHADGCEEILDVLQESLDSREGGEA